MLKEKAEAMQMWKTGYKKVKPKLDKKKRKCMMCEKDFMSEWIGNRICDPCKSTDYWKTGNDYSIMEQ
tara:strand:- start:50 stop:253 length:204 start_codon:yes stop_codon:yes gene_type:complete